MSSMLHDDSKARTRTITWQDPMAGLAAGADMTGLEFVRAIAEGRVPPPPIAETMGFAIISVDEGKVTFAAEPAEHLYNPIGVVHGGFAMTLLDSAMGCAVQTMLAAGEAYTSVETKVNFVRPITLTTGRVVCVGTLVHRGGTIATAEGRLIAEQSGKLLAHGTTTCIVIKR